MPKTAKKYPAYQHVTDAWLAWCDEEIGRVDFDATLHVPQHIAQLNEADALRTCLRQLFNRLDRHFLGTAHRRHGLRIPRFVTLERSDGVGWHAHVSLKVWKDGLGYVIDPAELEACLRGFWHDITRQPLQGKFSDRIVCFKPTHDGFLSYSLKHTNTIGGHRGEVDILNCAPDMLQAA